MNAPFSEALLREGGLISDRLATLLQTVSWFIPAIQCQVGRVCSGRQDGRGCPEERWDKTLQQQTRRPGAEENGPEQMVLEKNKNSRELHPDSCGDCAVSKVDLLGM